MSYKMVLVVRLLASIYIAGGQRALDGDATALLQSKADDNVLTESNPFFGSNKCANKDGANDDIIGAQERLHYFCCAPAFSQHNIVITNKQKKSKAFQAKYKKNFKVDWKAGQSTPDGWGAHGCWAASAAIAWGAIQNKNGELTGSKKLKAHIGNKIGYAFNEAQPIEKGPEKAYPKILIGSATKKDRSTAIPMYRYMRQGHEQTRVRSQTPKHGKNAPAEPAVRKWIVTALSKKEIPICGWWSAGKDAFHYSVVAGGDKDAKKDGQFLIIDPFGGKNLEQDDLEACAEGSLSEVECRNKATLHWADLTHNDVDPGRSAAHQERKEFKKHGFTINKDKGNIMNPEEEDSWDWTSAPVSRINDLWIVR